LEIRFFEFGKMLRNFGIEEHGLVTCMFSYTFNLTVAIEDIIIIIIIINVT